MPLIDSEFTPKLFNSPNEFSYFIEQEAIKRKDDCYSVIIEYCEINDVEYDKISVMINDQLKTKLAVEFSDIGLMKPINQLFGV